MVKLVLNLQMIQEEILSLLLQIARIKLEGLALTLKRSNKLWITSIQLKDCLPNPKKEYNNNNDFNSPFSILNRLIIFI